MGSSIQGFTVAALLCAGTAALAGTVAKPTFRLTAEERYDDDALIRLTDGSGQLMSKVSPQVGLSLDESTFNLDASYAADLIVRHGSGRTTLDHRGQLSTKKRFSDRMGAQADLRLWRVSDPTSLPRLGMARTLSPVLYGRADVSGAYLLTERLALRPGYRFEGAQVFDAVSPTGVMHQPSAEVSYRLGRRTDLSAEYRLQLFTFGLEESLAHGAFAGLRHRISRRVTFNARGGPVFYQSARASGLLPRVQLELAREGEQLNFGAVVGHDLVGASGFSSALWADFASLFAEYRFTGTTRLFGVASYFRNGQAPGSQVVPFLSASDASSQGYAVGGGVEWRATRQLSLQATLDRIAQVGSRTDLELVRNIAAVRLIWTALE